MELHSSRAVPPLPARRLLEHPKKTVVLSCVQLPLVLDQRRSRAVQDEQVDGNEPQRLGDLQDFQMAPTLLAGHDLVVPKLSAKST